ncbi:MAG: membrane protein insertase YidC [Spirochaetota bacterium]|jgi:YidC/Oxa1 family membrane protein insertase|nr:membrane protein insertase YidC [Spirochaetota bacterium]
MTKRLILAMGIWFVLLLIMTHIFQPDEEARVPDDAPQSTNTQAEGGIRPIPSHQEQGARSTIEVLREAELPQQGIVITTDNYEITLSSLDASVTGMKLLRYEDGGAPIDFIERNIMNYANFRVGFDGFEIDNPPLANWSYKQEGEYVHIFAHTIPSGFGQGLALEKRYTFYKDAWHFDLELRLVNTLNKKWVSYRDIAYSLIWGSPIDWLTDKEARTAYDKISLDVYHAGDDKLERLSEDSEVKSYRWIGLEDRYFLFSIIPLGQGTAPNPAVETASVRFAEYEGSLAHIFSLNRHKLSLAEGGEASDLYRVFFGPKKYSLLTDAAYSPFHLSAIFDSFVLIKWLDIAFEQLIEFFHGFIPNYAIVIILVTILIKLLLHPLTQKSFVSMRKMQLIQPKLTALREQFKNDPKRLNEEMMKMYKKEGVNPMGGCFPMLLQLPVFIALYQVLPRLADLKNSSFLWVQDLSSPDTVATISAFRDVPLLPYHLNILPLIMTALSVGQSLITASKKEPKDSMQQQQMKMMMFMPVIFLFLFWNMPSGLVLYWTVQTILSLAQQAYINRKYTANTADDKPA